MNKTLIRVIIYSILVALLMQEAVPQDTTLLAISSFVLVIYFMLPVFVLGVSDLREKFYDHHQRQLLVPLLSVLLPYIFIGLSSGFIGFDKVIFWYLLPSILLILPNYFKYDDSKGKYLSSFFFILGAALLWIGFDHRYTGEIFDGFEGLGYVMNSLWVVHLGFVTYGMQKGIINKENPEDTGLRLSKSGIVYVNKITPLASLFIIPLGLLTGFLLWNPVEFDLFDIVVGFIGIYLTIALQEEMIFRGIILKELDKFANSKNAKIFVLIFVSIAFAFTHWNNEKPEFVWLYFITAAIAGIAYGLSYRKAGLAAAMLSHTLIDWFWSLLLQRP